MADKEPQVPKQPPQDPDDFDDDFDDELDGPDDFDDDFDDELDGPDDFDDDFDFDLHGEALPLDDHESAMVQQDLVDLESFEETFRSEGYRGVSVYCRDCEVEHYYPWELLRENLRLLLETGETPVHEPAFDPDPADYVPWEYARGYVDALSDAGVASRRPVGICPTCGLQLPEDFGNANFCPRCASPLMGPRLVEALRSRGLSEDDMQAVLHEIGLPG